MKIEDQGFFHTLEVIWDWEVEIDLKEVKHQWDSRQGHWDRWAQEVEYKVGICYLSKMCEERIIHEDVTKERSDATDVIKSDTMQGIAQRYIQEKHQYKHPIYLIIKEVGGHLEQEDLRLQHNFLRIN